MASTALFNEINVCRRAHFLRYFYFYAYSRVQHFVLLYAFTFVYSCGVRNDFHIKTMFGPSLHPVVCKTAYVLSMLFVFVCI